MNRTIPSYLANVATAAEFAPFGCPGIFQMNAFMNNSLVWAAASVAMAQSKRDEEPTADNDERLMKANVRLHTIGAIYNEYAQDVAIPKLEMPHVERFLGLDKEPDITEIKNQATNAAKAALRNAHLSGRNPKGVYTKEYMLKTLAMAKAREERKAQLQAVYSLVHTEPDLALYDEEAVTIFTEKLHDKAMTIARGNWLHATHALTDVSLSTFNPSKYQRLEAARLGCLSFMAEFGITPEALTKWQSNLEHTVSLEASKFEATEAELDAAVEAEAEQFEREQNELAATDKAEKLVRLVKSDSRVAREAGEASLARKEEDAARKAIVEHLDTCRKQLASATTKAAKKAAQAVVNTAEEALSLHDKQYAGAQ